MRKASGRFLVLAEVLFLFSLFLPAIQITMLGKPTEWEGWRTVFAAICTIGGVDNHGSNALVFLAALGNLVFFVAPLLSRRSGSAVPRRGLLMAIICALVLAVLAPLSSAIRPVQLLSGYFVWLAAHIAMLSSAILASMDRRNGPVHLRPM